MIRCPACGSLLFRRRVGGLEVEGCPGCGGAFLDGGELRALVGTPATLAELDRHFRPGIQPVLAPARTDRCPKCEEPLVAYRPPSLGGTEVQGCRRCGGVFLDHGEATAIARHLAPPEPAVAPVAAFAAASPSPVAAAPAGSTAARMAAVLGQPSPTPAPAWSAAPAAAAAWPSPDRAAPAAETAPRDPRSTAGLPVVRGRRLTAPVEEAGFLGGLSRAFRFFHTALALAVEAPKLLAPLLAGGLAQAAVLGGLVVWLFAIARNPGAIDPAIESSALRLAGAGWALPAAVIVLGFVAHLLNTATMATTVSMIDAHLKGRDASFGAALRDVGRNFGAIVALAAVGALVSFVAGALRNSGRQRGLVSVVLVPMTSAAAGILETVWTALSFLLLPVIMVEDVGLGAALRRVRRIHRDSLLPIAAGEVGLRALGAIGGLLFVGAMVLLALALWPPSAGQLRGLIVVGFGLGSLLGVLAAFLRGAYYTCLYLWAAETERAGDPALATVPAPLADALA